MSQTGCWQLLLCHQLPCMQGRDTQESDMHNQGLRTVLRCLGVCPLSLHEGIRSFFSCCWETNPPLLFLAYFKSLTGIRRIQVKITGVTAASLTGDVFLQCKEAQARNTFMITTWTTLKGKKNASSFSFLYHNEHVSKYFKHTLKAMWLWAESSSPLQGKLPHSFLPSAETKLLYTNTHMAFFLWYQTSFPVSEGNFWLLK